MMTDKKIKNFNELEFAVFFHKKYVDETGHG